MSVIPVSHWTLALGRIWLAVVFVGLTFYCNGCDPSGQPIPSESAGAEVTPATGAQAQGSEPFPVAKSFEGVLDDIDAYCQNAVNADCATYIRRYKGAKVEGWQGWVVATKDENKVMVNLHGEPASTEDIDIVVTSLEPTAGLAMNDKVEISGKLGAMEPFSGTEFELDVVDATVTKME